MTSQSPAKSGLPTPEYMNAWMGTRAMLLQGASWSGRERNFAFLNIGGERFVDMSAISAADCIGDGRSMVPVDWDADGALDLLLKSRTGPRLQLFHNRSPERGNFVTLTLEGKGSNRDAIGARVSAEFGVGANRKCVRTLHAGSGFLAQAPKSLHFGIGDATEISRMTIRWPDGSEESFDKLAANANYAIQQGSGQAHQLASPITNANFAELTADPEHSSSDARRRVPLVDRLPLNPLNVPGYAEPLRRIASFAGKPTLLNLWGIDCAPCLKEFGDFKKRKSDIAKANLRIVPICTDLDRSEERLTTARERLERFGLLEGAGYADEALLEAIEVILAEVIGTAEQIPLPMSLLIDDGGQLSALYLGPLEVDRLLRDTKRSRQAAAGSEVASLRDRQLVRGVRLYQKQRNFPGLARSFRNLDRMDLARYFRNMIPPRNTAESGDDSRRVGTSQ